jgi:hypothetical protein
MNTRHLVAIILAAVAVLAITAQRAPALSTPMPALKTMAPVTCATTPTLIAPEQSTGAAVASICIQNTAAVAMYIGGSDVTTTNGYIIKAAASATEPETFCFDAQRAYCTVAASTQSARVLYGLRQ